MDKKDRLAQPEPEPVAWMYEFGTDNADAVNEIRWYKNVHLTKPTGMVRNVVPLYTAPPQRKEDRVWCVCGDQIMPDDDEAMCGTCIAFGRNDSI